MTSSKSMSGEPGYKISSLLSHEAPMAIWTTTLASCSRNHSLTMSWRGICGNTKPRKHTPPTGRNLCEYFPSFFFVKKGRQTSSLRLCLNLKWQPPVEKLKGCNCCLLLAVSTFRIVVSGFKVPVGSRYGNRLLCGSSSL